MLMWNLRDKQATLEWDGHRLRASWVKQADDFPAVVALVPH
jgi:hypothetical protein